MAISVEEWRALLNDDKAFLTEIVDNISGWLDRYAAKRTIDLLRFQDKSNVNGSIFEIGIFNGKYFSILVRAAAAKRQRIIGLDTFDYTKKSDFDNYFGEKFSPAALKELTHLDLSYMEMPSCDITPQGALDKLLSPARFVSVDGSHEYDDVLWDLRIADHVLAPGGIISADDYLNPICLGVTAAVDWFLANNPTVVPFAYVSNKLFLCRPGWADRYRNFLEEAILADSDEEEPKSAEYRKNHQAGARRNIEATYRGYKILTVRL